MNEDEMHAAVVQASEAAGYRAGVLGEAVKQGLAKDLSLLTIAATGGREMVDAQTLEAAIARLVNILYTSPLGGTVIPYNWHETPFGALVSLAREWVYESEDFCESQIDAARYLGRDRTMLLKYEAQNRIQPVWRMRLRQYLWRDLIRLKKELDEESE